MAAKTISFTYGDKDYVLEFTRSSIKQMEKRGFVISELAQKPMSTFENLFAGAFIAHHKFTDKSVIDEIYANMPDKENLIQKLAEMYNEPLESLLEDPVNEEGKVDWKVSW